MHMKPIQEALTELRHAIASLDLVLLLYDSAFIFLGATLLTLLLNLYWGFAFIPTLLYVLWIGHKKTQEDTLLRAEQTTPALQEKLRTAADNITKDNEIVQALHQEVIKDLHHVETAKFIDFDKLNHKTGLLVGLAFLIIILAYFDVGLNLPEFTQNIKEPLAELKQRISGDEVPLLDRTVPEGNLSAILGNKSLALLGKKEIIIQLNPLQSEINLEDIKEAQAQDFNPPAYPKEIYTSYDAASIERLPKQHSKIIKTYFEKISR